MVVNAFYNAFAVLCIKKYLCIVLFHYAETGDTATSERLQADDTDLYTYKLFVVESLMQGHGYFHTIINGACKLIIQLHIPENSLL